MAIEEYVGAIVMEVDGQEVDVESVDTTTRTGRKLVKTMNRTRRAKGIARGISEYELKVTAVIPRNSRIDWDNIEGARITLYPVDGQGQREIYLDCFTTEAGAKYQVDNEAKIDISMGALRKVTE